MERNISSLKELSAVIRPFLRRGVMTNAFLSPETFAAEIAEKRLFTCSDDHFLGIFLRRDGFCSLYYYTFGGAVPDFSFPLICEVASDAPDFLASCGFSPLLFRTHFVRTPRAEETVLSPLISGANEKSDEESNRGADREPIGSRSEIETGIRSDTEPKTKSEVRRLCAADAKNGFSLLSSCFDERTAALPTFTEFARDCENGKVLGKFEKDALCGLLRFSFSAKRAEIRHLCVSPSHRKKGIAVSLCRAFLSEQKQKTVSVFTGRDNRAACSLYESLGFIRDEITSTVYQKGVFL